MLPLEATNFPLCEHKVTCTLHANLADSDIDKERGEIFIVGDEHARLDGRSQVEQNIMTILQNDCRWRVQQYGFCLMAATHPEGRSGDEAIHLLVLASSRERRTVRRLATATGVIRARSEWYGFRVSVPFPR